MGPNKTAIMLPGGPRVISVFDVSRWHRAQIKHFLGVLDGSRTPSGLGLKLVSHLHRMRTRFEHPIALKALDLQHVPDHASVSWTAERIGNLYDPSASVCGLAIAHV